MSKQKKTQQLGMNPSTASGRLVKDTLFRLVKELGYVCHQCGGELTRDDFSIEHKTPWLDSEDPLGLYFDQKNISFSHLKCNIGAARKPNKRYFSEEDRKEADRLWTREYDRTPEAKLKRKERRLKRFKETGKW